MTRISKRLKAITSYVAKDDKVVDVGCDHGLLSIYLVENNLVSKVIASDVNENALKNAISNIEKRNLHIKTVLSDGIEKIDLKDINTLIISGMGTSTILHILHDNKKLKKINKLIIQANNDYYILRENLNEKGYYLKEESYTYDKNKWYVTSLFVKSDNKNTIDVLKYGFLNNEDYNDYLLKKNYEILKKIPFSSFKAKFNRFKEIRNIKKAIYKSK